MFDEMMKFFVVVWLLGAPIALVLWLIRITLLSGASGLHSSPNAAFWTVMILCPPLGLVLAAVRFIAIPVCKACARDWKAMLSVDQ